MPILTAAVPPVQALQALARPVQRSAVVNAIILSSSTRVLLCGPASMQIVVVDVEACRDGGVGELACLTWHHHEAPFQRATVAALQAVAVDVQTPPRTPLYAARAARVESNAGGGRECVRLT
eukprot:CAMPEP_0202812084 /NCGR_PEP_ID=MMETSP1389-20130828/3795_1 /ASSEMBLY_ACC=CAM_ASM_000865 /TAXON_ID=302021 /ORGANISM="Rhodomonas sp., Strain CCMP768" /LENGTH=121 /DNA_ID=CAMNT_0049483375 /DNA_START=142 /DNA_END=503 /DNA_ORIENTATION=-